MKKDYMTRLERAARWRLPRLEAEDIISDYRDIVGTPPRPDEELRRDVGDPEQVVKLLVSSPRAYHIWLAVFIALSACILIPGVSPLPGMWRLWTHCFYLCYFDIHLGAVLAFLGMAGALVWFRWKGYKKAKLPRAIPVLLALLLVWTGAVLLIDWLWLRDPLPFAEMWGETPVYALFGLFRTRRIHGVPFCPYAANRPGVRRLRHGPDRGNRTGEGPPGGLPLDRGVRAGDGRHAGVHEHAGPDDQHGIARSLHRCLVGSLFPDLAGLRRHRRGGSRSRPMLKKDLIELCLLHLLAQGDQYGYELLRQLHDTFPDTQESAVYALRRALARLGIS